MNFVNNISKVEHRFLLAVSLLAFMFFASFILLKEVEHHNYAMNQRYSGFSVDSVEPEASAGFNLFTFFIFLSLIKPKRFLLSTLMTVMYAALLLLSLYIRVDGETPLGGWYPPEVGFFGELYRKTWVVGLS